MLQWGVFGEISAGVFVGSISLDVVGGGLLGLCKGGLWGVFQWIFWRVVGGYFVGVSVGSISMDFVPAQI